MDRQVRKKINEYINGVGYRVAAQNSGQRRVSACLAWSGGARSGSGAPSGWSAAPPAVQCVSWGWSGAGCAAWARVPGRRWSPLQCWTVRLEVAGGSLWFGPPSERLSPGLQLHTTCSPVVVQSSVDSTLYLQQRAGMKTGTARSQAERGSLHSSAVMCVQNRADQTPLFITIPLQDALVR